MRPLRLLSGLAFAGLAITACGAPDGSAESATEPSVVATTVVTKTDGQTKVTVHTADGRVFDATRTVDGWRATPSTGVTPDISLMGGGEACNASSGVLSDAAGDSICFDTAYEFWDLSQYCMKWVWVHGGMVSELMCVQTWYMANGGLQATSVAAGSQSFCLSSNPFEIAETVPAHTSHPVNANEHFVNDVWVQPAYLRCASLYSAIP